MVNSFINALHDGIDQFLQYECRDVLLFHHNDTDGITSAAILVTSFKRAGYVVSRFALEKPYPEVLERIFSEQNRKILVFADFAGKIAPRIAEFNKKRNLVLILDHHPAEPSRDDTVITLDPDLFGLKGDLDISASAACYLFAKLLNPENIDLSPLAVLGAVGDGFFESGALVSCNRNALMDAVSLKLARTVPGHTGEQYFIRIRGVEYPCAQVVELLDTLGAVGYYSNGADAGFSLCNEGLNSTILDQYEICRALREDRFSRQLKLIQQGSLHDENKIQWFDSGNEFSPMGVKMIGVFCNELKHAGFLDETKYLAGFQHIPNEIPGFGRIRFDKTKISMRVSDYLAAEIRKGKKPGLDSFLPEATLRLGGFADACHGLSAATTIDIGMEHLLMEEAEAVLKELQQ